MKKKLILKKIKIAALNEQEQQQVYGGKMKTHYFPCNTYTCHNCP